MARIRRIERKKNSRQLFTKENHERCSTTNSHKTSQIHRRRKKWDPYYASPFFNISTVRPWIIKQNRTIAFPSPWVCKWVCPSSVVINQVRKGTDLSIWHPSVLYRAKSGSSGQVWNRRSTTSSLPGVLLMLDVLITRKICHEVNFKNKEEAPWLVITDRRPIFRLEPKRERPCWVEISSPSWP